ncbi:MAG: PKD domain-containing protein, partial [Candidatus Thermoplasmatota archaeon]|nr:PKD domain-containing protein [Candidatus Thermoplasmatota archaeon]
MYVAGSRIGASNTTTFNVTTNIAPTANFTYTPSSPTTADTIQFTDTSTDVDGTIVSWSWQFGDGVTSTLQNSTHQYSS